MLAVEILRVEIGAVLDQELHHGGRPLAARTVQEMDSEVICCENEQRTAVLVELARNFDLPYVPFKMVRNTCLPYHFCLR